MPPEASQGLLGSRTSNSSKENTPGQTNYSDKGEKKNWHMVKQILKS